jgi:hypothetical protein
VKNENDLCFPVLCLYEGTLFGSPRADALTSTTTVALRDGLFEALRIVDSEGRMFVVQSVRRLHSIGPLWGFNFFLNRRIRITIDMRENGTVSADGLRQLVLRDFTNWHGWRSRGDFAEMERAVENSSTVAEIIRLVTQ